MMKELEGNIKVAETVACGSYVEASSDPVPAEVDIKDCQSAMLVVDVGTLGSSTDGLIVELHGADASGGTFAVMEDKDGNDATVTITEAGLGFVEVCDPKRYVKAVVTQESTATDVFGAVVIAGRAETLPIT